MSDYTTVTTQTGDVLISHRDGSFAGYPKSEAVSSWVYLPDAEALVVNWKSGRYIYAGVPMAVVARLMGTDSVGRFVNTEVKPHYEATRQP